MGAIQMPHIGGIDPAGEIVGLGADVDMFAIGDRVAVYPVIACGECDFCQAGDGETYCRSSRVFGVQTPGGRAEYTAAPVSQLVRLPASVSFEAAAALGVAYTTTWHGLVERAGTGPRDTLLVMGAGGGCGVAAVQLGKHLGARVLAVSGSQWKRDRLLEIGADDVFSYRDDDWVDQVRAATGGRGVSVAFDNAGAETLAKSIDCLDRRGRLFCSGGTTGLDVALNVRRLYREHLDLKFYVQGNKADMEHLVKLVSTGELAPVIDRVVPLADAARADEHLMSGSHFGRIVISVAESPARRTAEIGNGRLTGSSSRG
jgi:NADPH:quinone reductase-like Zn-dependent oxidoreductase